MGALPQEKHLTLFEIIFCGLVGLYALISLTRIITTTAPDFGVLYKSAKNLLAGRPVYEDLTLTTGLGYPTVSLLPFLPFAFLPYVISQALFLIGSFGALLGSVYLSLQAVRVFSYRSLLIVSSFAFLSFPTKFAFGMGQANYYALFFLLLGASSFVGSALRRLSYILALLLKPHLIFVYIGLLCTQEKRQVVWSMGIVCGLVLIVGVLNSFINEAMYLNSMVPGLLKFSGREIYYNQGIQAFIARIFGSGGSAVSQLISGFVVFFSFGRMFLKRRKLTTVTVLAITLPMYILIEPLAWQHHLVFLLPVFVWLWFRGVQYRTGWWHALLVVSYIFVSWNIKYPHYFQENMIGSFILSHAFFGVAILWYMALRYL